MPRFSRAHDRAIAPKTLVIDNGACSIKAGFTSVEDTFPQCHIIQNALIRDRMKHVWVGGQFDKCHDYRELLFRRPMEKGFIVNWEIQKEIWEDSFFNSQARLKCDPAETNLILTEAPNAPQVLQTNCDQIVFEEYEFTAYCRTLGPTLNAFIPALAFQNTELSQFSGPFDCSVVVDCGYSHTTVTPVLFGRPVQAGIRRLDIGGKVLTNFLKETISVRSYNMMDETYIINEMKEKISYVSNTFSKDLDQSWKGKRRSARNSEENVANDRSTVVDYVLPNIEKNQPGYLRSHDVEESVKLKKSLVNGSQDVDAFITVGNERFAGPELLFNPSDIGFKQLGVAELVVNSLDSLPKALQPAMLANVIVTGGTSNLEGFATRL